VAALMAWFVLRPMRRKFIDQARQAAEVQQAKDGKSFAGAA
jgi:OFA family oxalate/formate antiporter-like MFS transporter